MEENMLLGLMKLAKELLSPNEPTNIFEGPFTRKKVEILDFQKSDKWTPSYTYYLEGNFNDKNCGNGVFNVIKLRGEYSDSDKDCYVTNYKAVEKKIGEYEGEVKYGKIEGIGIYSGQHLSWMIDSNSTKLNSGKHTVKGNFKNNSVSSDAKYYFDDKLYYHGDFVDGVANGEGILYLGNNGQNVIVDINKFRSTNSEFEITFFNNSNNSAIFKGIFSNARNVYDDYYSPVKLIRGTYYLNNKPYHFNDYYEVELPDGTYKLEEPFQRGIIDKAEIKITKYDRNAQLQEWFEAIKIYLRKDAQSMNASRRKNQEKLMKMESAEEIFEDDLFKTYFEGYLKSFYYSYIPLSDYGFHSFTNKYARANKKP